MNNQPAWALIYFNFLVVTCAAACWVFVLWYSLTHKWWKSDFGRHLVAMSASLGALLAYVVVVTLVPDLPGRWQIRLILFTALTAATVWRVVLFGRYDLARRREIRNSAR